MVALVLPGGGARGAYEAGAMSALLPALEARGERISIYCGTSVGAINAVALCALAHLPAAEQGEAAVARWRHMRKADVIRRIVGPALAVTAARCVAEAIELPWFRLSGLLDPAPLSTSLDRWIDWEQLHANLRRGHARAACVVASSLARGGPVAFVESRLGLPVERPSDAFKYERARLRSEHVRASAAIPLLFPPVEITTPRSARGHYIDGGTRLNTPIKPALALGADRVIVIGLEPLRNASRRNTRPPRPRLADVASNVLDGLLVDQVAEDLERMVAINSFFAEHAGVGPSRSARAYRRSRGRPPYRRVSYALVSPAGHGEIGALAERVFDQRYGGLRGLRDLDYAFLGRALGRGRARGELLSFLLFEEHFTSALLEAGRRDAYRWLDRHPHFWCHDPAHDFLVDPLHAERVREDHALDEWRALRRP